ncbi:MAG: RagB/SusD family nutrient uptake outer membrane protein [Bacteroidaceae bacterium]
MKKIFYLIALFIVSVFYTSCGRLDMTPEDYFGAGNFWNNEAQVNGYVIGLHNQLRSDYNMYFDLGELRGGNFRLGTSSVNTSMSSELTKKNLIDKDHTGISNFYGLYGNIMQVNHFIDKVENACTFLSDTQRKTYLAEAHGLRALYYYMLYKTYGGVPIVTTVELLNGQVKADNFYVPRNSATETMDFIKTEINKSEESYVGNTTIGSRNMWSRYATLMLKADIYLWSAKVSLPESDYAATGQSDLEISKIALTEVLNATNLFDLQGDFASVFSDKKNKEIIFSLAFEGTEATNNASIFFSQPSQYIGSKYTRSGILIEDDMLDLKGRGGPMRQEYKETLWRSYDDNDTRRDATFYDFYDDAEGNGFGCMMRKGIGSINSEGVRVFDTDIIVYRYADALLMMAEVENGLGNPCASYINQIRSRAYGDNFTAEKHYAEGGTFAANELAILQERDKEFVWEGKRWFDVLRMQDASKKSLVFSSDAAYPDVVGEPSVQILPTGSTYLFLWPLDTKVLGDNKELTQTPGF